jgi:hypothetical protein
MATNTTMADPNAKLFAQYRSGNLPNTQINQPINNLNQQSNQATNQAASANLQNSLNIPQKTQEPKVIDSGMLSNLQVVNIPTKEVIQPNALIFDYQGASNLFNAFQPEQTNAQNKADELSSNLFSTLPKLSGQTQELQAQQDLAGVNQLRQDVNNLNSLINIKNAELAQGDAMLAAGINNIENQAIPMEFITGQQASLQRQAAIVRASKSAEIGMYTAQLQAKNGSLTLALDTAQRAVDVKYAPIKEYLSIAQQQLEAIQPILNRDEKRQAEKRSFILEQYNSQIADAKILEKQKNDIILTATQSGAPGELVDQAGKAKTPLEVAKLLGRYSPEYLKYEMLKQQIATEKMQRAKIGNDIRNDNIRTSVAAQKAAAEYMASLPLINRIPSNATKDEIREIALKDPKISEINEAFSIIKDLNKAILNNQGFKAAVGFKGPSNYFSGTKAASFIKTVDQLKNILTLPNLEKLKGAMSDADRIFITNTVTKLDGSLSQEEFKAEMEKLTNKYGAILSPYGIGVEGNGFELGLPGSTDKIPNLRTKIELNSDKTLKFELKN